MRKMIAYLTALIMMVSCMAELEQGGTAVEGSLEGSPVSITFSVPDIRVLPATKSLEDGDGNITGTPYLDPDKIYLVVCGSSQSIKYIRKATLLDSIPDEIPQEYYPLSGGDRHTTLYRFKVQLELSDFGRTIHILGNVDENQLITGSYSYQNLPGLLSYNNKQAYWQKLYVPHIKAKIDPDTQKPIKQDGCYVPDDETQGFFQYIPLIRNFAKIHVTNASDNFQLHSYAVIFYPDRGSVVPYRSNEPVAEQRFDFNPPSGYRLSGYEKSSFEQLEESINYLGNMPAGVALNDFVPPASEFEDPSTSEGRVVLYDPNDTERGFYIYERGVPTDKIGPTFIIVCGKFEDDDNWYYYRIDLMESKAEGTQTVYKYYPIYRNFYYNIQVHRISSEGVLTPDAAVNSSGAEDISADVSMRHLSDISNGTTRLVVEPFMTRTYSGPAEEGYYELYARFFNSVNSDVPNTSTVAVRVELEPMTDGSDDILILYDDNENRVPTRGFFFPEAATVGGVEGIRTIRFNTVEPLDVTKTQKIKITGHNPGNPQDLRLYREVEITLQNKQPLTVTCTDPVPLTTNTSIDVGINIPKELPESMFPLEFIVEPEAMTLTPDTGKEINMPVVSGKSIATTESAFKDTPAFYYLRTLTWDEFLSLDVNDEGQRTFHCYFKPNREFSATTIWVYNEYFSKGWASYENKIPLTLTCTNPVVSVEGTPVTLAVTIHSGLPQSMFPLEFKVEPEDMTLTPDMSQNIDMPLSSGHFIRTLDWNEYTNLPTDGKVRTFYCYFKTTVAESATTIWVSNDHCYNANVSFQNVEVPKDNHFWVKAVNGTCYVKINESGLQYKKDNGGWAPYSKNARVTLAEGGKVSFKGGSASSKKTWSNRTFICTGGQFEVGGNFASLVVGDDYATYGESVTGVTFVDFFNSHTGLKDAYELELPMKTLAANAYKSMFDGCTNLERGPRYLPATTLAQECYRNMFRGCTKLEVAPDLNALGTAKYCYSGMFKGCTNLRYIKMLSKTFVKLAFIKPGSGQWEDGTDTKANNWVSGTSSDPVGSDPETGDTIYRIIWLNPLIRNSTDSGLNYEYVVPDGWQVKWVGEDEE